MTHFSMKNVSLFYLPVGANRSIIIPTSIIVILREVTITFLNGDMW